MQEKLKNIVELLDKADGLFCSLAQGAPQAASLWESGLDKMSAALWLLEKLQGEVRNENVMESNGG